MATFRSRILVGQVIHHRQQPVVHSFQYPACYYLFDVDELPALGRELPWFGYNRWRPIAIHDSDYGRPPVQSLRESIERFLYANGIDRALGRIELLTQARTFGYVFNPVSYFYCFTPAGEPLAIVAEVNNTFGDRIRYLLDDSKLMSGRFGRCYRQPKEMHVSPFMPMPLEYQWHFWREGERLTVHMDETAGGERFFAARLRGQLVPLTARTLMRSVLRFPLMPVQIIAKIHWQALRLYLKGAPYFPRPNFRERWAELADDPARAGSHHEVHHDPIGVGV